MFGFTPRPSRRPLERREGGGREEREVECVCVHMRTRVCVCVCACVRACVCVCVFVWMKYGNIYIYMKYDTECSDVHPLKIYSIV